MKNTKNSAKKRLIPAAGSLLVSAVMLSTSTYAWFTMNKEVTVTGMSLKAHSEEGLLINEVAAHDDTHWDDAAQAAANPTVFELRPTSTYDLATWWHANSKKSADEAGIDAPGDTVAVGNNGEIYTNLSGANDEAIIAAGAAQGGTQAETHVFYTDASYGTSGSYQNGEGYYVRYTYYLKSSGQEDFKVTNLQAKVKATVKNSATVTKLDPALRVGIAVPASNGNGATIAGRAIFSPVLGSNDLGATDTSYSVTMEATGKATGDNAPKTVTPVLATQTGAYSAYQTLNLDSAEITIPKVTDNGIPVYVYVWFEGEDTHCMSDNLTATLNAYDIDITFNCNDIGGTGKAANPGA